MSHNRGSTVEVARQREGPGLKKPSLQPVPLSLCPLASHQYGIQLVLYWGSEGLVGNEELGKSPHLLKVPPRVQNRVGSTASGTDA